MKLSDQAKKNKTAYNIKYARENYKGKNLYFNTRIPEDIALFDWIKEQPEGGTPYIKRLIREDMEKRTNSRQSEEDSPGFMPGSSFIHPAQIPIRVDRFKYLTRQYTAREKESDWELINYPGHFVICNKKTGRCAFDASYTSFGELDECPEDEIAAVIYYIRICREALPDPTENDGFGILAELIQKSL